MKKKKEEQALFNVLKRVELKTPSPLLTEHVLEQIQQEQMEIASNDLLFDATLKKAKTASAPSNLSYNVISQLKSKKKTSIAYKPLISKNVKYMYTTLMSLGILYLIFSGTFSLSSILKNFSEYTSNFTLVFISCLCLIAFAFLDVFLKKRNQFNMF